MGEELDAADAHRHGVVHEQRVFRSDDQVAWPDQHQTTGNALALHLGDGRLGDVAPAFREADVDFLLASHLRLDTGRRAAESAPGANGLPLGHLRLRIAFGHIMAGGEVFTIRRENDHLDLVVAIGEVHGGVQFIEQVGVLRIALVGAIEADAGDMRRRFLVGDCGELGGLRLSHGASLVAAPGLLDWVGSSVLVRWSG
ncbi:hypothetical protein D3C78_952570 [compost metagenome]